MKIFLRLLPIVLLLSLANLAHANLDVFACEPEWAALTNELGGDKVTAYSATTAFQDPHYIQAKPSLIAKVRNAELLICTGAELEIGWLPVLLQKANNPKVQAGSNGFFEASSFVKKLDITGVADRSQGDIHPQGNPHIQTNPHNVRTVAVALAERLRTLDSNNAEYYQNQLADFLQRWDAAMSNWETKATPLRGKRMITHHKSWVYLQDWLGITEVANLEPVSGVPPTTAHLSELLAQFKNGGADFIVRSPYQDDRGSKWLSDRSQIKAIVLPFTVGGSDEAKDLFGLFDDTINQLLGALP